ncbi:putative MFS transporter superfamily [Helianthus anomalus]
MKHNGSFENWKRSVRWCPYVQPCVGIWSDKCTSKYGRRRPFILLGSLMISLSVLIIGFSADIGYLIGDTQEHCSTFKGTRPRAAFVFILGFWMLDLANNTVQGPARALLADLAGPDQRNSANAIFCLWMAVGNILGFSSGSSGKWHRPKMPFSSLRFGQFCNFRPKVCFSASGFKRVDILPFSSGSLTPSIFSLLSQGYLKGNLVFFTLCIFSIMYVVVFRPNCPLS